VTPGRPHGHQVQAHS